MSNTQQIISELNATIGGFTNRVNVKVQEVNETSAKIKATADSTIAEIRKFKTEMIENEQMQSAQESILRINQIIRERFYDYDTIRKTVMGVVKDFDLNLVRNKTIEELSEELWITSSRYWLSYTLIALSAWVNDNRTLAGNAIAESIRTDEVKTSLFFCLTNLRFGRIEVARAWLSEYFRTIVPDDLKDEASVMLQSYINGVFGVDEELQYSVQSLIDLWIAQLTSNEELSNELINMYNEYLENLRPNNLFVSKFLQAHCTNYNELALPYNQALKYDYLIKKIKEVDVANLVQNASNYKKRIDIILKDLITNYDAEEKELKEQQEYFQLIIDNKGKEEVAAKQYNELMAVRNQKHNFGKKCVEWALYSKNDDINVHVRKFGIQNTKSWFLKALSTWSNEFENKFVNKYNITIPINEGLNWSCESNGEDEEEQISILSNFLEEMKKRIIWDKKVIMFGIIAFVAIALSLLIWIGAKQAVFGIIFGIVGLAFAVVFLVRVLKGNSRYTNIYNNAMNKIKGCMGELTEYRRVYFENRNKKGELFSLIEHL